MPLILAISMECVVLKECKRTCRITATNKSTHIIHIVVSVILSIFSILHTRPKFESINLDGYFASLRRIITQIAIRKTEIWKFNENNRVGLWRMGLRYFLQYVYCVRSHVGQTDVR